MNLRSILIKIVSVTPVTKFAAAYALEAVKRIVYFFCFFHHRTDDNLVVFHSFMGKQFSCNPKALYLEMLKNHEYDHMIKVWAFKNPEGFRYLENNPNTVVVKYGSYDFYDVCSRAKYWITNSRCPSDLLLRKDQMYLQCWHGTPLKKLGFDIKHFSDSKIETFNHRKEYLLDAKRMTHMISSSDFYTEKMVSAFQLERFNKSDIFIKSGFPRNDYLFTYTKDDVNKIKTSLGIPFDKKVILYAPTWRENQQVHGIGYTYSLSIDFEKLKKELEAECVILFRAHYLISNSFNFESYKGFIYDVSTYGDISELYTISDMCITDYSSVFFDYAVLERPILFYMYDFDEYKNKLRDFYFDLSELPGKIVYQQEQLVDEILDSLDKKVDYSEFNAKFNPVRRPCSHEVLKWLIADKNERM